MVIQNVWKARQEKNARTNRNGHRSGLNADERDENIVRAEGREKRENNNKRRCVQKKGGEQKTKLKCVMREKQKKPTTWKRKKGLRDIV